MPALTPDQWRAVSPYLDEALAMDETERAAWLVSLRSQDPALAADVEALLEEHRAVVACAFLEQSPMPVTGGPGLTGSTIGAYTLVSPIGEGGMGSVWLAKRSDGRFERQVAVKFLSLPLAGRAGDTRFKREGSILGRLAHPHIAELIDAGVSPAGHPYLVLERVEGLQIDTYCDQHKLDIEARIRLFLDVLAAVAHAHANLIVHRDLKPSNVLVSNDGQVKLLDFGIAKLIEDEAQAGATQLTRDGGSALTPAYAAPEQVTGAPISTATDIYALGVLLYQLLSGQHPAGPGPHSPADLIKAIVQDNPPPMSGVVHGRSKAEGLVANADRRGTTPEKLTRALRGDLDTIVAKALKKTPEERYASVTAFADDVRRYLDNEPISARPDSITYRAAKFIRRNRTLVVLSVSAIVIVITSLSTGLLIANRERAIAERRFLQVRQLANRFIDLDNDIRGLPGAIEIRRRMVSDSLQYLTSLGKEVHGDKDLALEIANAYVRVAHVLGDPTSPNLGQFADADKTLQEAEKFVGTVLSTDPRNRRGLFIAATIAHDRMVLAAEGGRQDEVLAEAAKAAALLERVMSLGSAEPNEAYSLVYFYVNVAINYENSRHFDDAIRLCQRALDLSQSSATAYRFQGGIYWALANARWQLGDLDGALEIVRQATALQEKEAASGRASLRANLADTLYLEGMILGRQDAEPSLGRTAEALVAFRKGLDIAEDLAEKDPKDYLARHNVAIIGLEIGNILRHSNPEKGLEVYEHALTRIREAKASASTQREEAELLAGASYAMHRLGRDDEAKRRIEKAFQLLNDAHQYPADKIEPMSEPDHVLRALADEYAETGQMGKAVATYEELLNKLMAWNPKMQDDLRDAMCISRTWTAVAELLRRVGRTDEAVRLETRRAELWNLWKDKLPNGEFLIRQSLSQPYR